MRQKDAARKRLLDRVGPASDSQLVDAALSVVGRDLLVEDSVVNRFVEDEMAAMRAERRMGKG